MCSLSVLFKPSLQLFFTCGAGDDASYVRFRETKDKYFNRSLRQGTEMRRRNLRSDSVIVHTGYTGTGAQASKSTQRSFPLQGTEVTVVTERLVNLVICSSLTICAIDMNHSSDQLVFDTFK